MGVRGDKQGVRGFTSSYILEVPKGSVQRPPLLHHLPSRTQQHQEAVL